MLDKMDELKRPHDKFVKNCFSNINNAKSFFCEYLPEDISKSLNFDTLELQKDSFVDKDLKEYFSDLLFKVNLRECSNSSYVYILFEHKSYVEKNISLQLLSYMLKIWEKVIQNDNDSKLPLIIPIVFYHGSSSYNIKKNFSSKFDVNAKFHKFIPDFEYILTNVSSLKDKEIKGEILLKISMLSLKYIFSKELKDKFKEILFLFEDLINQKTELEYLETVLRYIVSAAPVRNLRREDLEGILKEAFPKGGDKMFQTIADVLKDEGKAEGKIEGKKEGKKEGIAEGKRKALKENVIKMYKKNLSVEAISELLELDKTFVKSLINEG